MKARLAAWFLLGLCALPAAGWACPGCKEALVDSAQTRQTLRTAKGYALSIGLLLTLPAVAVGAVAVSVARASRQARGR
jgi:hypothetical protein